MKEDVAEPVPEPTNVAAGEIKAISKDAVHRICSGQVVLSLAVAVKELVENAIDAGATNVEVRLREQGLAMVEVMDNGSGVQEHNLAAMTAKYHTSKLSTFSDLLSVETFGFRGEALSSLCSLANMTVVTRHKSSNVATHIELDHEGHIKNRRPCARSIGTTVTLTGLFATLPVRQREFARNIKREFTKMCNILQAYCIVAKGTRILCTNQNAKGVKSVIMQTHGSNEVLANIAAIFGNKQTADIVPLIQVAREPGTAEVEDSLNLNSEEWTTEESCYVEGLDVSKEEMALLQSNPFELEGFVSHCNQGAGRSSKDRQFFYINSRPCEPKKIAKLTNDIYHRYNMQQLPFVYLNIKLSRNDVDINLTPDKRQLLVNNEKILLYAIKRSLIETFERLRPSYKIQNNTIVSMLNVKTEQKAESDTSLSEVGQQDIVTDATQKPLENDIEPLVPISSSQNFINVLSQWKRTGDTRGKAPPVQMPKKRKPFAELEARRKKLMKVEDFLLLEAKEDRRGKANYETESSTDEDDEERQKEEEEQEEEMEEEQEEEEVEKDGKAMEVEEEDSCGEEIATPNQSVLSMSKLNEEAAEFEALTRKPRSNQNNSLVERIDCKVFTKPRLNFIQRRPEQEDCTSQEKVARTVDTVKEHNRFSKHPLKKVAENNHESDEANKIPFAAIERPKSANNSQDEPEDIPPTEPTICLDNSDHETDPEESPFACEELTISLAEIEANLQAEMAYELEQGEQKSRLERLRFKSEINPSQNKDAENELKTEISKEHFAQMEIIGQFNLGFIIVKLADDLFIVDQHASDEQYNFEDLQQKTVLQTQRLAVPQTLQLTAVNEMVLLDHLDVFVKNGFKLEVDEAGVAGRRVRLLGKPFSKNWAFGQEDIDELIFMLQDAPKGTVCRPSRIRAMFASRACRMSIMIGQPLNKAAMRKLIDHMGDMELPWNCPHGRPTMRHLINTEMLTEEKSKASMDVMDTLGDLDAFNEMEDCDVIDVVDSKNAVSNKKDEATVSSKGLIDESE